MGNDNFFKREEATNAFHKIVVKQGNVTSILKDAMKHPDTEIVHRAKRIIEEWYSVVPTHYPYTPCIDMHPAVYHRYHRLKTDAVVEKYVKMAQCMGGPFGEGSGLWWQYRVATQCYIRELLDSGWNRKKIQKLLDKMARNEIKYLRNCGHKSLVDKKTEKKIMGETDDRH